jgi:putative ubiquitin-RnfH superfamily antitoxin RatB of RatAB toxin-antitoxin module
MPPRDRGRENPSSITARTGEWVEVVYALPDRQHVVVLELPAAGMTAFEACERSGLLHDHPETATAPLALGVFGVVCSPQRALRPGDRVEIYRPLKQDPRVARRERVSVAVTPRRRKR